MRTPFPLLAALYSFFLVFANIASAQGGGEGGFLHRRADSPSRTTQQNFNHPTGPPKLAVRQNGDRVREFPAEATNGKHQPPKFPTGQGNNVPFARVGGNQRVKLNDVDRPNREAFANKQQSQTTLMPPPSNNGTNSTANLMRRWTNPYKLPYVVNY